MKVSDYKLVKICVEECDNDPRMIDYITGWIKAVSGHFRTEEAAREAFREFLKESEE